MDNAPEPGSSRASPVIVHDSEPELKTPNQTTNIIDISAVGGALRKNADGSVQAPKVIKRKPKGQKVCTAGMFIQN